MAGHLLSILAIILLAIMLASAMADSNAGRGIRPISQVFEPRDAGGDPQHALVGLKLTELAEEMQEKIEADEARIQFENRGNLNGNAVPSLVLRMKEERVDEQARRIYEIYCDVWKTQGYVKSAPFIRAVWARGILTALRARSGTIAGQFAMFAQRTSFPGHLTNAHLSGFRLRIQRLEDRWARRLEAEAKECEHAERRIRPTASVESGSTAPPTNQSKPPRQMESPSMESPSIDDSRREAIARMVQRAHANRAISTSQAAEYFEVSPRTIHRWVEVGKLRNGGRRGSITIESIQKWERKRSRKRRSSP